MFRTFSILLVCCVFVVFGAAAQEADTVYVLPEVTIESSRLPRSRAESGTRVITISSAEIGASGARRLDELLAAESSIFIRRYGAVGIGGISLRGTGPSQTTILLDGHPLSSPQLGQVDLSLLPSFMLSSVQVMHGGGAALFGSSAIGGVVNLDTFGAPEQEGAAVTSTIGPWGERAVSARYAHGIGRLHITAAAEAQHMKGDFPYVNETRFPIAVERRRNADRDTRNLVAALTYHRDRSRTRVAGWLMTSERGLPGIVGSPTPDERQWDQVQRFWLQHQVFHPRGRSLILAAFHRSQLRYRNPVLGIDQEGATTTFSAEGSRRLALAGLGQIQGGLTAASHRSEHPALPHQSHQHDLALFLTAGIDTGPVSWYPSVRSDWILRDGSREHAISGSMRSRLGRGPWYLKTGVERSFRAPTQNDLFWRGAGAAGNEHLKPEYGTSADAGLEFATAATVSEVTLFYQVVRDQITWLPNTEGVWSPSNVGRVRSVGAEMSVNGTSHLGSRTRIQTKASYTYTRARDVSEVDSSPTGNFIRYVPAHVGLTSITAHHGSFFVGVSVRGVGRRYLTSDRRDWLEPYATTAVRLGGRFTFSDALVDTAIFVENLFESEFEVMSGYPMPPRHVRIRVSVSLPGQ